jgi:hypothetical protein
MTCSDIGEFEFITRPYPYPRQPFQLTTGELVAYESRFFSMPAYGLLADKRLFTGEEAHPVSNPLKLYINKDASIAPTVEPTLGGAEYVSGTPHYVDYITDLRSLMLDVFNLHAADSDWSSLDFLQAHLSQARSSYAGTSADDVSDSAFVHPEPANVVPSGATPPGSSGSIPPPGDGHELGAQQLMDVDIDEVQYQPMVRPTKLTFSTPASIPTGPIFPAALPGGAAPSLSELDKDNYSQLGLGAYASGGILLTGDVLVGGLQIPDFQTSVKFMTGSGQSSAINTEGSFAQVVPWALFPAQQELCSYYTPDIAINTINASGRQALYDIPTGSFSNNTVLLLNVSKEGVSGQLVSNYPTNYHATSGIDGNGHAHGGVHIVDKLIYNLSSAVGDSDTGGDSTIVGFSPVNGKRVFAHWVGSQVGSEGETWNGSGPKYQNEDTVYGAGNIVLPFDGTEFSTVNWANTNNLFSPVNWAQLRTSALGPRRGFFGAPDGVTYGVADIQHGTTRGVITRKVYAGWGFVDQIVAPDLDQAQGGQRVTATINYVTHSYKEGRTPDGEFIWVELDNSPSTHSSDIVYYNNTYFVNNIFSFFFLKKPTNGLVHVNGEIYVQWSPRSPVGVDTLPRKNFFAPIGIGTEVLVPSTTRSDVIVSIGFFPDWARRRYVTTNNQISRPGDLRLTPSDSFVITFHPDLDFDDTFVNEFGPPVWDPDEGVNYLYFLWSDGSTSKMFFAHMDTDFRIFRINETSGDGFLTGRPALLSI